MKSQLRNVAVTVGLFCAATGFAQTAAPAAKASAPVSTSVAPAVPAAPAAKTPAAPVEMKAAKTAAPAVAAAGGGAGKVWVNAKSRTYHCEGAKFYGKTKAGEYMTEADAKAKGNHADHGKACAK